MSEEFIWTEKYRPSAIDDCILPNELKSTFKQFLQQGELPNMIFSGGPGVGKTTVAKALLNELNLDYMMINGSLDGNIDTLRTTISQYASTVSLMPGRKYVILDEADYLNPQSTQPALRNFMEEFSRNCGFILTCNFKNRIIEPLQSRCSLIDFKFSNQDLASMAGKFMERVKFILDTESVSYDEKVLAQLIMQHLPDWRRVLNELQKYAANGKIDTGILVNLSDDSFKSLCKHLKAKDFVEMRKWIAEHSDVDTTELYTKLYNQSTNMLKPAGIAQLVLILAKYQYQAAFVASQEVNNVACMTEIMMDCDGSWK